MRSAPPRPFLAIAALAHLALAVTLARYGEPGPAWSLAVTTATGIAGWLAAWAAAPHVPAAANDDGPLGVGVLLSPGGGYGDAWQVDGQA